MIPPHAVEAQRLAEQMRGQGDTPIELFDVNTSDRPVCDPATLAEPCTGCNRDMHRSGNTRMCRDGHPRHHGNSLCTGCASRARRGDRARAAQAATEQARRPAAQVHTYCVHDEGERCACDRDLRREKEGISRR